MHPPRNLTEYEEIGLSREHNLADGHAHQGLSASQGAIIRELPAAFSLAEGVPQSKIEAGFVAAFFELAGQPSAVVAGNNFLSYSASVATEILANFLRRRRMSVALVHPSFDNIAAILTTEGLDVFPLEEDAFSSDDWESNLDRITFDALFVVWPNNPTGWAMGREQFHDLVEYCRSRNILLVIDFCFRLFNPDLEWDQYAVLLESGVNFIAIEDTGKAWPTLDMKVSITSCSLRLASEVHELHTDVLLNVSPFILTLLTSFIRDTQEHGVQECIRGIADENRALLHAAIEGTILTPASKGPLGVEWLRISGGLTGRELWELLGARGVFVLPGDYFYWLEPARGSSYIRVALMRPRAMYCDAVAALREGLLDIERRRIAS
jgi:aspartate/methionine/tyrosine aminotransferase